MSCFIPAQKPNCISCGSGKLVMFDASSAVEYTVDKGDRVFQTLFGDFLRSTYPDKFKVTGIAGYRCEDCGNQEPWFVRLHNLKIEWTRYEVSRGEGEIWWVYRPLHALLDI